MLKYLIASLIITTFSVLGAQTDPATTAPVSPSPADTATTAPADATAETATETASSDEKPKSQEKRNTIFDNAYKVSKFRPQYINMGKDAICSVEGESIKISAEEIEKALAAAYDHIQTLVVPEDKLDKRTYTYSRDQIVADLLKNRENSMVQAYGRRIVSKDSNSSAAPADNTAPAAESTPPANGSPDNSKGEASSGNKDFIYLNIFLLNAKTRDYPLKGKEYMSENLDHWRIKYDLNSGEVFELLLN